MNKPNRKESGDKANTLHHFLLLSINNLGFIPKLQMILNYGKI